jgi:hypothetical protein
MKKLYTLLALVITLITFAQAPQGFNYQATVRNSSGALIVNQNVLVKFNIYQNTATGTIVYSENQSVTTDDLGHINLVVGQGTSTAGTFTNINWGSGSYFLGIELNTGSGYLNMGTTQLMSVPYALYSSNGTPGPQGPQGIAGPIGATGPQGLTGATGAQGPAGTNGTNGTNGQNGISAYQIWLNAGNTGTEAQFLTSLQGPQGVAGPQGPAGTNGTTISGAGFYQITLNISGGIIVAGNPIESVLGPNGENKATLEADGWSFTCPTGARLKIGRPSSKQVQPLVNMMTHGNNGGNVLSRVPSSTSTAGYSAYQTLSGAAFVSADFYGLTAANTGFNSSATTTLLITFGLIR